MKLEKKITTDAASAASVNFQHPAPALSREDLDALREYLRVIAGTAGNEPASEETLDVCGRYAARALKLIEDRIGEVGRAQA